MKTILMVKKKPSKKNKTKIHTGRYDLTGFIAM